MTLPADYHERVYAGVLGKIIGVYLGRPFEQWSHDKIEARWGEIRRYVHEDCGKPLVVPDDDITGTFTFMSGDGKLRLLRVCHETTELASVDLRWAFGEKRRFALTVSGNRLTGSVDGLPSLEATDPDALLDGGSAGWRISAGRLESDSREIRRADR